MRRSAVAACLLFMATASCTTLPPEQRPADLVFLDQNWTAAQRNKYYHISQGTRIAPYSWFMALEQPVFGSLGSTRFADPEYLARFGFLPDPVGPENPDGLPVGFARDDRFNESGEPVIGMTCAACHTGELRYRGRSIRIDGGPAMTDIGAFQQQFGLAIALTYALDWRFDRFARKVLGANDTPAERQKLRARLDAAIKAGKAEGRLADELQLYPVAEGVGRLDALGRGANYVFGTMVGDRRNYAVADAPVSYPPLWDAPWFDWAQYNGSILQPMARNVAEAMGVRSVVKLSGPEADLYRSTVRIENLHEIEQMLAGPVPGGGLRPPRWPEEILGKIDAAAAERGKMHFARLCAGCHEGGWTPPDAYGRSYRRMVMKAVGDIGTDPKAAMNFVQRTAYPSPQARMPVSAAEGLKAATTGVIDRWYQINDVPPAQRVEMNGYRPNEWRSPAAYRAPALHGVWATAPYLHNGSVPNLYQMLVPAERRDAVFYVGRREFDPKQVGVETGPSETAFRFDTSIPGNWNRGHEFRNAPLGNGVIGPELSDAERWELIEYLKTY